MSTTKHEIFLGAGVIHDKIVLVTTVQQKQHKVVNLFDTYAWSAGVCSAFSGTWLLFQWPDARLGGLIERQGGDLVLLFSASCLFPRRSLQRRGAPTSERRNPHDPPALWYLLPRQWMTGYPWLSTLTCHCPLLFFPKRAFTSASCCFPANVIPALGTPPPSLTRASTRTVASVQEYNIGEEQQQEISGVTAAIFSQV